MSQGDYDSGRLKWRVGLRLYGYHELESIPVAIGPRKDCGDLTGTVWYSENDPRKEAPYVFRAGKAGGATTVYWAEDPSLPEYAFTYQGIYSQRTIKVERRVWSDPGGRSPKDVGSESLDLTLNDDCSGITGLSTPHLYSNVGEQAHTIRLTRSDQQR